MSFRTGFIARGFIPLGTLSVSLGYGPLSDTPIVFPTEVKVGKGRRAPRAFVPKVAKPEILTIEKQKKKKRKCGAKKKKAA